MCVCVRARSVYAYVSVHVEMCMKHDISEHTFVPKLAGAYVRVCARVRV